MRRKARNARRSTAAAATASDQSAQRHHAESAAAATVDREHIDTALPASPTSQDKNTAAAAAGPWSHGRGLTIKKQQQQQFTTSPPLPAHHQYYPSGQFHLMSSSPLALTPSLSPLYKVPAPNYYASATTSSVAQAAATTAAALARHQPLDETLSRIFTTYLPNFFDAIGKFQYHQALATFDCGNCEAEWRDWDAFRVMQTLAASCESTYHVMKYLEPDVVHDDAIDRMYSKLIVLLHHLSSELQPIVVKQQRKQQAQHASDPTDDPFAAIAAAYGDLSYYAELLDQAAAFFSLRLPMLEMYRSLALATQPLDCEDLLAMLERVRVQLDAFDHPLLETIQQTAMEENRTVVAALETEVRIAQYDFTKAMVALHRLKQTLASWSEHIDAISDYALFDESGTGLFEGDGGDGDDNNYDDSGYNDDSGRLLEDEDVDNDDAASESYALSDSLYSNVSFAAPADAASSYSNAPRGTYALLPTPTTTRRTSHSVSGATTSDYAPPTAASIHGENDLWLAARNPSVLSIDSTTSAVSEVQSTISRLLSQSSLLKRSSVSGTNSSVPLPLALRDNVANMLQRPGDPYASTGSATIYTNTLEQAILGGAHSSSASQLVGGHSNSVGANANSRPLSAAEMIALSMKKQERDDGFLLPVFQWAKRFYRSLVAKYSLYFHQWLAPLERQTGDFLAHDLTRFIKSPMGISYLQLMDVLLARGSYRGNDSSASILLVLETAQLADNGAHYYENGYLCPSTSRTTARLRQQPEPEDPQSPASDTSSSVDVIDKRQQQQPLDAAAAASGTASTSQQRKSPRTSHGLFMQVDTEREEEQSDFSPLWGLRGWPAVFCYPNKDPPLEHWPNIVSLIMDNRIALEAPRAVISHLEKRLQTSYYIARIDPCVHLVLLLEGKRRPTEKTTQDFMQTLAMNLQHGGAFDYARSVSVAPTSATT